MILSARFVTRSAMIAVLYVVVTFIFREISFLPQQIRVSEALAVLPFLEAAAIPGLFIGVLISNLLFGNLGVLDVLGGSFLTLLAAYLTHKAPNEYWAIVPPIVINAFGVSAYLSYILEIPYWPIVGSIFVGQLVAVGVLGLPLLKILKKYSKRIGFSREY